MGNSILETITRILVSASVGTIGSFAAVAWTKQLLKKRNLQYSLDLRAENLLTLAMTLVGGAIGYFTSGLVYPAIALVLLTICAVITVTDWTHMIIPNQAVLAVFGVKLIFTFSRMMGAEELPPVNMVDSIIGLFACFAIFCAPAFMGNKVGAGDIKLGASMGFLLGTMNSLYGIVFMGLMILAYGFLQRKMPVQVFLRTNVPMGPFIAAGMMFTFIAPSMIPSFFAV